jgi:hypothetical protein
MKLPSSVSYYSRSKLVVLSILVVAFFIFNYLSLTYFAKQNELKDKIAELVIYQFTPKTLREAPFVGEAVREGIVGGFAIQRSDNFLDSSDSFEQVRKLSSDIQELSRSSSQLPVLLTYDYALLKPYSTDTKLLVRQLAKLKSAGFNLLLLPYAISSEPSSPLTFVQVKHAHTKRNTEIVFTSSTGLKLSYLYHPQDIEQAVIAAFNSNADLLYIKQAREQQQLRIFQIVNIVYKAVQEHKIDRAQIEQSYNKIHKLRADLK